MTTTKMGASLLLLLAACSTSPPGGGGGGGGEGGASTTTTVPTIPKDGKCEQHAAFAGSTGCYLPDPDCCELDGTSVNDLCEVFTLNTQPAPLLCTWAPNPAQIDGAFTDHRDCTFVEQMSAGCTWGPSILLCCAHSID